MKCYLCKFIPPRAGFLETMTADESELMRQHGVLLDDLLRKGLVVAHGPVLDSTGGYGLSLYRVDDDRDMAATTSEDPAVKGGVGRYEIYQMLHLKTGS